MHKILLFSVAFAVLFVPLCSAEEPYTKEAYIQDCHENRRDDVAAYCECHYKATVDFSHSSSILLLAKEKEKAENSRQKSFEKLEVFSGVTEVGLAEMCGRTNGFWDTMAEFTALKQHKTAEARAKKEALSEVLNVEKVKAEDVFTLYKNSHGMVSSKHTHDFDNTGQLLSTNLSLSYCAQLKDLDLIEQESLTTTSVPPFEGRSSSPDVQKCYALIKPAKRDPSMNTSRGAPK